MFKQNSKAKCIGLNMPRVLLLIQKARFCMQHFDVRSVTAFREELIFQNFHPD